MLRNNKTSSSMQKTYDECYLICSTAVYFEGQNNEEEALRSWRSALDRIYYHNAYKVAPNYQPASATEKALQDSLREMELQCKERVTLLEALKKSREETAESGEEKEKKVKKKRSKAEADAIRGPRPLPRLPSSPVVEQKASGWIGNGTVPPVSYNDIPQPAQPVMSRPRLMKSRSSDASQQLRGSAASRQDNSSSQLTPQPLASPAEERRTSRTPSPEKKMTTLRTTLRPDKNGKKPAKAKEAARAGKTPTVGLKAAGLAWGGGQSSRPESRQNSLQPEVESRRYSGEHVRPINRHPRPLSPPAPPSIEEQQKSQHYHNSIARQTKQPDAPPRPPKPGYAAQQILLDQQHAQPSSPSRSTLTIANSSVNYTKPPPDFMKYRSEYSTPEPISQAAISAAVNPPISAQPKGLPPRGPQSLSFRPKDPPPPPVSRRPVPKSPASSAFSVAPASPSASGPSGAPKSAPVRKRRVPQPATEVTPPSSEAESNSPEPSIESKDWRERLAYVKKHLPTGVDEAAAKSIFNEIVVEGDEVHWEDVAGLDGAKSALKEAVVYPFLRPDLFMGLREPARGMLLFGPPGTGKTMIARACATESKSTFFAISASSLTSKWMGESEKLVRALFQLSKALAPSIIFVDEIDSLLSSRGDGEHETTRRIKTEFLIQWSDLQRAAAGKEAKTDGDATRVLVLAATNLPWAIDEAARRRFVRRQYIPLPEGPVREQQFRTLLGHQKHTLSKNDIKVLVELTDGYSGSDITALAKDAAMGPLRSLGESLLHMSPDDIRPIMFDDFEASLINIRPSVSKEGLKEFEEWAAQFGERA